VVFSVNPCPRRLSGEVRTQPLCFPQKLSITHRPSNQPRACLLGHFIQDHRGIERDHERPFGSFRKEGDVGCEYSILQGANSLLIHNIHSIRITIKCDPSIKMSLYDHTTKRLHALPGGFGPATRESTVSVRVDGRNLVQSLSID